MFCPFVLFDDGPELCMAEARWDEETESPKRQLLRPIEPFRAEHRECFGRLVFL